MLLRSILHLLGYAFTDSIQGSTLVNAGVEFCEVPVVFLHVYENTRNGEIGGEFSEKSVALGAPIDKQSMGGILGRCRWISIRYRSVMADVRPWTRANGGLRGI